ncbi:MULTISPECIES: glycosyltransferase family 2 protein [unclassified Arthrobacter]|uniref:glycosyltransferase family 2 protein n=1 Tax=unclassified Arthrobacter TaxID=235627 RepID=UPI0010574D86|nr:MULTISPECIES: glycosyltransferase family 2 protein [unclassified Arthrobacter]
MTLPPSPSVAVIMRSRNRSVLLDRALRDLLGQSMTQWTLVVVNDGGDRAEVDPVVDRYRLQLGDRVQVIHHDVARGMEAASNAGIKASDSEFIAIHDDDDEWHPEFLERTLAYLAHHDDAGVAVRTELVYERITDGTIEEISREIFQPQLQSITLFDTLRHNRCVPISLLYRRSVHDRIGYYNESLSVVGDWEFQLRLLQQHTLGFLDEEPLAFWNQRKDATGDLGNSVIVGDAEHRRLDQLVREIHLKEHVSQSGLGSLLYQTSYQQREFDHLHHRQNYSEDLLRQILESNNRLAERVQRLEEAVSDASLVSLVRRRYRQLKSRILGR